MTFRVYALLDPRDNTIRYVGCTAKQLAHRLTDHLSSTGKAKRFRWIKELRALNLRPEIHLLEEVTVARRLDAHAVEQRWVKKLKDEGHDLLNDWPTRRAR